MKTVSIIFLSLFYFQVNSQGLAPEMVLIEGGNYFMGNQESEYVDEYPRHDINLRSFYLSKNEVTNEEFSKFSYAAGLAPLVGKPDEPATRITWNEAVMYCNWLSSVSGLEHCYNIDRDSKPMRVKFNPEANGYRLPTEAEWEYAARGGIKHSTYAYSGSDDAHEVAWFMDTGKTLHTVGQLKANDLGLYDMSGNVKEWCWDFYLDSFYNTGPTDNPTGPTNGTTRVVRGGSYNAHVEMLRVTKRYYHLPDEGDRTIGIRLAKNQ